MFDYEWFHKGGLARLQAEAIRRCSTKKLAGTRKSNGTARDGQELVEGLDTRTILYMKDGLTYEMKEISAEVGDSSALAFECVPVDENYKAGAIVLIVPYEDIARVEVFAVHPDDKPQENIRIGGFRAGASDSGRD